MPPLDERPALCHSLTMDVTALIDACKHSKESATILARTAGAQRSAAIAAMATMLRERIEAVEEENGKDIAEATAAGLSPAMVDRLTLSKTRILELADALEAIATQEDLVGTVTASWTRPNGLKVSKQRIPLGVILMIYESRPNVTMDAAALCLRSGNAALLRGGSEALHSNRILETITQDAIEKVGLPKASVQLVPTQAREAIDVLLQQTETIDLVIPRGGEKLIRRVVDQSKIPVVQHYRGLCHIFVDDSADLDTAVAIVDNAKTQRPGVCNAVETLLVHQDIAKTFLPRLVASLESKRVELRGDTRARAICSQFREATEADWDTEFLDLTLAVKVVDSLEDAIAHIDRYGTFHTASILSQSEENCERFCQWVDASCVLVNASTRFNDGGALGLGAEMGISTTKIHAYGPMGTESLCAEKYVVRGAGQIRS